MVAVGDLLIVAGGESTGDDYGEGVPFLDTIEIFNSNQGWRIMNITMPNKLTGHCSLTLPDNRVIFIGGYAYDYDFNDIYYDDTWIMDVGNESWSKQSPMQQKRAYHGCTTIMDDDEKKFVIVSGGETDEGEKLQTAEAYDIANNIWSSIKDMPKSLSKGQLIADGRDGVLMIGGDDGSDTRSTSDIFYLSTKNGDWAQTFKSLDVPSSDHVALLVPDSLINC